VRASGSAQVRASGSAQVRASGSAQVHASKYVAVTDYGPQTRINGGVHIVIRKPTTPAEWCELHGATVDEGIVTLYKAVDDDYATGQSRGRGIYYTPGATPEAPDWDGGKAECGGGLHFTARPWEARAFNRAATRYIACPVALEDLAAPHLNAMYPAKIKARRISTPGCVEVDVDGNLATEEQAAVAPVPFNGEPPF